MAMVNSSQIQKATDLVYQQVFDGELYFSDLRRAVENNWSLFHNVFSDDLNRFSESMKVANKARADAHAKPIEREEFESAMSAINWLAASVRENA